MVDLHTHYPLSRARMVEDAERAVRYRLLHPRASTGRRVLDRLRKRGAARHAIDQRPGDATPELDRAA